MTLRPTARRGAVTATALLLVLSGMAACGDEDDTETTTQDAPMDPDQPVSSPDEPADDQFDDPAEDFSSEDAREEAEALLGEPEGELDPDVRIRRRGAEDFFLTEDYRLGRITVELDDDGSGTYVVTAATVELPDGPETFTA